MVILFTNLVLGQATVPVLRLLKIPIGVIADEDDLASPQSRRIQTDGPNAEVGPPPASSMPSGLGPVFDMDDLCGDWYANVPPGYFAAPGIRWENSAMQGDPEGDTEGAGFPNKSLSLVAAGAATP